MYYFSVVKLNMACRRVRKELANTYELHRTVMRCFPENLPDGERVLYSVGYSPLVYPRLAGPPVLYVQSQTKPSWDWLREPGAQEYALEPAYLYYYAWRVKDGACFSFSLKANPTVKRNGRRYGLTNTPEQREWLTRKARTGGFQVLTAAITAPGYTQGCKTATGHPITLFTVRFTGVLRVTDAQAFWKTVLAGIGSGKGFGCGLLQLGTVVQRWQILDYTTGVHLLGTVYT